MLGPVQGTGNSTMNKTRSLPSTNLRTQRKKINRWIQQGIGTVTRPKSRLPRAVNWVLLVQGTGKSLPQVMEERGLWGWGEEARESRVKGWKHHLGSDPGSSTVWASLNCSFLICKIRLPNRDTFSKCQTEFWVIKLHQWTEETSSLTLESHALRWRFTKIITIIEV